MSLDSIREPLTYSEHAPHSFYRDVIRARMLNDDDALGRLDRHEREMNVEQATRQGRAPLTETPDGSEIQYRQTRVDSNPLTGGEFTVPLWLIDKFATAGRAGRPFADVLNPMLLPPGVSSVHIPRINTGSTATYQGFDGAAAPGGDPATTDTSSNVATIAGEVLVSQQLFDLSPIGLDAAFFLDLTRSYNRQLEFALLYGASTDSQSALVGLANIAGVPAANKVSGAALTTVATQWPALGQVAANVGNNRLLPPEYCLMAPRRWFWLASSVDSSSRPIASPNTGAPMYPAFPQAGGADPVGRVLGITTYLDGVIPAGTTADDVWFVRPSDMFLWESTPRTIVAPNPLSATLQLRLSLHRYVAFVGSRYPTGIGRLSSLPQPASF